MVLALLVVPVLAFVLIYRNRKPDDVIKEYAGTEEDRSVFVKSTNQQM